MWLMKVYSFVLAIPWLQHQDCRSLEEFSLWTSGYFTIDPFGMSPEPTISWCARPSLSVSCMNFWITEDGHGLSEVTQLLPGGELIVF
jgi:hypothetical protein